MPLIYVHWLFLNVQGATAIIAIKYLLIELIYNRCFQQLRVRNILQSNEMHERHQGSRTHAREARALLIGRLARASGKHDASMSTNATNTRFLNVPKVFLSEMHGGRISSQATDENGKLLESTYLHWSSLTL